MEPENQEIKHDIRQQKTPDDYDPATIDLSYKMTGEEVDQDIGGGGGAPHEYSTRVANPPQYLQQAPHHGHPQDHPQPLYVDQYPPPGAGQVSPYQPVAGNFPQKDARMYHQQQQQQHQQFYPGTVMYHPGGPGTSPYGQAPGAQLYPGYGTTQQMVMGPGPQLTAEGVTFIPGTVQEEKTPQDYKCLSIFACLFLFCPTGCIAIYFSSQTRESIRDGDMNEAHQRSKRTLKMVKISLVFFLIGVAIFLLWKFVISSLIVSASDRTYTAYDY